MRGAIITMVLATILSFFSKPSHANTTQIVHVDAKEASSILTKHENVAVLDVRTGGEYEAGHIQGAVNINYYLPGFSSSLQELDKTQPVLVHCKSGGRSTKAMNKMKSLGFTKIYHLDGGFDAWQSAKLEVKIPNSGQ